MLPTSDEFERDETNDSPSDNMASCLIIVLFSHCIIKLTDG